MRNLFILFYAFPFTAFGQSAFVNTGNFRLHAGTNITYFGDFTNSGTLVDSSTSVNFQGNTNQSILGSSVTTFRNLSVNNVSGITLGQQVNVSRVLTLTDGAVTLNSRILYVLSGNPAAIIRTNGYLVSEQTDNTGRLRWNIGTTTGAHEYPFGTSAGAYIPFTLNLTAGNIGNVTLATYPTAIDNTPFPSTPDAVTTMVDSSGTDNSANTVDRFWQIDKDGPSGTATLTFTATQTEVGSTINLRARRWNTGTQTWETPPPGQTFTDTSATVSGITNFSPWTMAGDIFSLPMELLSFSAQLNNGRTVDLSWITLSEINNDYFTVERSQNLVDFETLSTQDGAGNSNKQLHYEDVDQSPYPGISYYRLKQTDYDGSYSYSAPISIQIDGKNQFEAQVYPVPSTAGNVHLSLLGIQGTSVSVRITDKAGKHVSSFHIPSNQANTLLYKLPEMSLSAGVYFMSISAGTEEHFLKFVIL